MNFEKILTFANQNLAEYYRVFYSTLTKTTLEFPPVVRKRTNSEKKFGITTKKAESESQLEPKLLVFAVISVFVGTTVSALIPSVKTSPDITALITIIVIIGYWFLSGTILHWFCRVLRGRGSYLNTLSISIQVFLVLYVLSSFITFLVSTFLSIEKIYTWGQKLGEGNDVGKFIEFIIAYPVSSYFIIQGVLVVIYVPIAIRHVHRFGWFRLLLVMVFTTFHIPVSIIFYEVHNFVSAPIG